MEIILTISNLIFFLLGYFLADRKEAKEKLEQLKKKIRKNKGDVIVWEAEDPEKELRELQDKREKELLANIQR